METLRCFGVFNSPSSSPFLHRSQHNLSSIKNLPSTTTRANCSCLPAFLAAAVLFSSPVPPEETLANIPQTLSDDLSSLLLQHFIEPLVRAGEDARQARIQRPRSKKAESCTAKCVGTCIRGGAGSPGEGILNIRSLVECSDICNLIKDGDDGP
ncbi:hypothetical protein IEQ34_008474 [Dendrobium chrysotoxum]|uniref:Uncharacterized protein n=1 Tax=Dendrobium chrysotoxum TaxID=161865 RepID=A0AAV7GYQ7_DENCH|nr:hypothetical protein IEQ34_008474 [Dendrobium chrysotoxum]